MTAKSFLQGMLGMRRWELIHNWRVQMWRLWSVRLQALGLILLGWANLPLDLWNLMPVEIRDLVPSGSATVLAAALFIASMIARFVLQKKLVNDIR